LYQLIFSISTNLKYEGNQITYFFKPTTFFLQSIIISSLVEKCSQFFTKTAC